MEILKYDELRDYENILNDLIIENWQSFFEERKEEYKIALNSSITYVIYDNSEYCGFIRAITDGFITIFVSEIIINENKRHKGFGKKLIEYIHSLYPKTRIDLISDSDDFYKKIGFKVLGTGMRKHDWY